MNFLSDVSLPWLITGAALLTLTLAFLGAPLFAWTAAAALLLLGLLGTGAPIWAWIVFAVPAVLLNVPPLRRALITGPMMRMMKSIGFLPAISETERAALEAGTVWMEGELFSGKPDWQRIFSEPWPEPNAREQAFLDGPVEEICAMVNDWDVFQHRDLPEEAWTFLKENRFFGMIIPEEYGGLGFSPTAVSAVIAKLCSRTGPLGISVMIPNSLGPGELLSHYGTEEQKKHWLPRLAEGKELPCFALTEPGAGSDAGSLKSSAEVFAGEDGAPMLRLNWNKRYISLAGRATVLGLAVRLNDPNNMLGKGEKPGITCLLLPANTPGVSNDRRHDPLGIPFSNCPLVGEDVVVPASSIIGGADGAGKGWRMLMECLAAGRGIMLPAQATAGLNLSARMTGAYATVRKQFGLPIGKFEGIVEPLARIGGNAYTLGAANRFTCGALESGGKPAVASAIAKFTFTEMFRAGLIDAMDILGGAGISRGPRNMIAHAYMAAPIAITVEGANILTRTLMIFGQGAIRCHPFAYREIRAAADDDVKEFDVAFCGHIGHVVRNAARALVLSLTRGRFASTPFSGASGKYARRLSWASSSFAITADVAMGLLGGDLKRRESLTGRFSDVFSWLYLSTAVLRRFEEDGRRKEDEPFFHWAMEQGLAKIQEGFDGIYRNFPAPMVGWFYRGPVHFWSRLNRLGDGPSDRLDQAVARALQTPGEQRPRLFSGLYVPASETETLGRIEHAFKLCYEAELVVGKVKAAMRAGTLERGKPMAMIEKALRAGVISDDEVALLRRAEEAREDAIQVDTFSEEEYMATARSRSEEAPNKTSRPAPDEVTV